MWGCSIYYFFRCDGISFVNQFKEIELQVISFRVLGHNNDLVRDNQTKYEENVFFCTIQVQTEAEKTVFFFLYRWRQHLTPISRIVALENLKFKKNVLVNLKEFFFV